jgi:tetratricopeptide (TPR) repeat protein
MALSEIEKLERRYAENPQGLTFAPLAEVHRKNGDVPRALELLKPGLSLHPDYIPARIVLGRCHLDLGELTAAEAAFTHVLGLDGENVIALKALADITERQGRFDEAERWLRTLLAIDRSNDDARDQLGRVEATRRQTGSAAVVDAPPADAEPQPREPEPAEAERSDVAAAAATVVPEERPATGMSPAAEPLEQVTGWVADSGSPDAVEATPLDLEALDRGQAEGPRPEGIQLEQPVTLEDSIQPIAGLVGRDEAVDLGSFDHVTDFRVETAEDIVLNSSGGGEFQVANAAEELLGLGDAPQVSPRAAEAAPLGGSEPGGGTSRLDDDLPSIAMGSEEMAPMEPTVTSGAREAVQAEQPVPEPPAPAGEPTLTPRAEATTASDTEDITAEAAVPEWARPMQAAEQAGTPAPPSESADWTAPWSRPREPEPAAPEPAASWTHHAPPAPAATREPSEPDLLVTASMAELLLQQGHAVEALTVYRLLETRGGEPRYREKIAQLERLTAPPASPEPPAPAQAVAPGKAYSVQETRGRSVRSFLQAVLAARPPVSSGSAPVHSTAARPGAADPAGAPTRPAHDSLSLSSVFGEESGPTLPAVPAAGASAPDGVSYDEFFSGSGKAPAVRPARPPDSKSDDLDQFHAWLQNLKR